VTLLGLLALIWLAPLCACDGAVAAPRPVAPASSGEEEAAPPPGPVEVIPPVLDFGLVDKVKLCRRTFHLHNRSGTDLTVIRVNRTCGCINFEYDPGPIPAGESREVVAVLEPRTNNSRVVGVSFVFNDEEQSLADLRVEYFLRTELQFDPPLLSFGRCRTGSEQVREVEVRYRVPATVGRFPIAAPSQEGRAPLEFELDEAAAVGPESPMREVVSTLTVRLDTSAAVGPFRSGFQFTSADYLPSTLPVVGEVHPGWYLEQASIHFGIFPAGKTRRKKVRLWFDTDRPPTIEEITCDLDHIRVRHQLEEHCYLLTLIARPGEEGEFEGRVKILGSPSEQPLVLIVKGIARG